MKIAILADIHSNAPALKAVLADSEKLKAERYVFLGDLVGYGPHPCECLEWFVKEQARIDWVMGNHDAMLRGVARVKANHNARKGIHWLEEQKRKRDYQNNEFAYQELTSTGYWENNTKKNDAVTAIELNLEALEKQLELNAFWKKKFIRERLGPMKAQKNSMQLWLVHASRLPGEQLDPYIYPWSPGHLESECNSLIEEYRRSREPLVQFYGHSHIQYLVSMNDLDQGKEDCVNKAVCIELDKEQSLGEVITLINPGSVGQPRNGDTRACYALLDTSSRRIKFRRVAYDLRKTTRDMTRAGYPSALVERLEKALIPTENPLPDPWKDCLENQKNGAKYE